MRQELRIGSCVGARDDRYKNELCCISLASHLDDPVMYRSRIVSNARIVFQFIEWEKIRIAGEDIAYLLCSKSPPMSAGLWQISSLESLYNTTSSTPIWKIRKFSLSDFLALFPRTFKVIGSRMVSLRRFETRTLLDSRDEVMRNCAYAMLGAYEYQNDGPSFKVMVLGAYYSLIVFILCLSDGFLLWCHCTRS